MENSEQGLINGTQTYNLKWTNHTNNILNVLTENLIKECLVDVTLTCEGQYIKAHKMILSACSLYFQEVFEMHAKGNAVIIVNGVNFNVLRQVVEFMYRGEVKVAGSDLENLLSFAESLQIKGLCNIRGKSPTEEPENVPKNTTTAEQVTKDKPQRRKRKNSFSQINSDGDSESISNGSSTTVSDLKKSKCGASDNQIETLDLTSEDSTPLGDDSSEKVSPNRIPRPPNAFMIFANEWRKKLANEYPGESNKEISVRLGNKWKSLSNETKNEYYEAAKRADQQHKEKYPGYYYSPMEARLRKSGKPVILSRKKQKSTDLNAKIVIPDDDKIVVPDDTPSNDGKVVTSDDDDRTAISDVQPRNPENDSDDELHIVEDPVQNLVTNKHGTSSADNSTMPVISRVFSEAESNETETNNTLLRNKNTSENSKTSE